MYETLTTYFQTATSSDFFAGGIALGVFGTMIAFGRMWWRALTGFAWRRMTVTVSVDNRSPAFKFLCLWLEDSGALRKSRRLRVTQFAGENQWRPAEDARVMLAPSNGLHWFVQDGVLCLLSRSMNEKSRTESFSGQEGPLETIDLTLLGGTPGTVEGWIARGAKIAASRDRIGPGIFMHGMHDWTSCGDVPRRAIETIATEDNLTERLLDDVRWFYRSRDWYAERGVPWRRGYLLHGPPGTGKSSLIRAVASEIGCDIATLDLGRSTLGDDGLREAMASAPKNAILAFEDIDAVMPERDAKERKGVSFSGLLNAIDGVAAQEGRAVFMTTNHPERLDPALTRPGRADAHFEVGPVGAEAASRIFRRFFPGAEAEATAFARNMGAARIAPAALQGWLLEHHTDAAAASRVDRLVGAAVTMQAAE